MDAVFQKELLLGDVAHQDFLTVDNSSDISSEHYSEFTVLITRCKEQIMASSGRFIRKGDPHWEDAERLNSSEPVLDYLNRPHASYGVIMDSSDQVTGVIDPINLCRVLLNRYRIAMANLNTLMDLVDDAVAILSPNYTYLGWNIGSELMYNRRKEEVLGHPQENFFDVQVQRTSLALASGKPIWHAIHTPRPDKHVINSAAPVWLDGEIISAISVEKDISHILQLNEQLFKERAEKKLLPDTAVRNDAFDKIIGRGEKLIYAVELAKSVAPTRASVLIQGETGVGKELFAEAIHKSSNRAEQPFRAVNCGTFPPGLLESEIFGYEAGAFTGADRRGKRGMLEEADKGTLFLDEVGDMPLQMQVELLRVLENGRFYRIGGSQLRTVDVRILAATNRDFEEMIKARTFREDLFYRLNVFKILLPSLRDHPEDIPELFYYFIQQLSVSYTRPIRDIEPEVFMAMQRYAWPGNVRELRNVTERMVVLADGGVVKKSHLPLHIQQVLPDLLPLNTPVEEPLSALKPSYSAVKDKLLPAGPNDPNDMNPEIIKISSLSEQTQEMERRNILKALETTGGNHSKAAQLLGITRPTLYHKLKRLGLK
ncbi:MAG: sigma 54-interacting transcriptional regulator [Dehalobacterium sp.]